MNSKILDMDYTVGEVELTYKSTSKSRNKTPFSTHFYYTPTWPFAKEGGERLADGAGGKIIKPARKP